MAFKIATGVRESANNPGTGTVTLAGAVAGRRAFGDVLSSGDTTAYVIDDGTQMEWGIGTFTAGASDTISRDTVMGNTDGSTSKLNFTGACYVYISPLAKDGAVAANEIVEIVSGAGVTVDGVLHKDGIVYAGAIVGTDSNLDVVQNTSDGSDNASTRMSGGGDATPSRGSVATSRGNEHATEPGFYDIQLGNVSGAKFRVRDGVGTTLMTVDEYGHISLPLLPVARRATDGTQTGIATGSNVVVLWQTADALQGLTYSAGVFTATRSGTYRFDGHLDLRSIDATAEYQLRMVSTSKTKRTLHGPGFAGSSSYDTLPFVGDFVLAAGDTLKLEVRQSAGVGSSIGSVSSLNIRLVG